MAEQPRQNLSNLYEVTSTTDIYSQYDYHEINQIWIDKLMYSPLNHQDFWDDEPSKSMFQL